MLSKGSPLHVPDFQVSSGAAKLGRRVYDTLRPHSWTGQEVTAQGSKTLPVLFGLAQVAHAYQDAGLPSQADPGYVIGFGAPVSHARIPERFFGRQQYLLRPPRAVFVNIQLDAAGSLALYQPMLESLAQLLDDNGILVVFGPQVQADIFDLALPTSTTTILPSYGGLPKPIPVLTPEDFLGGQVFYVLDMAQCLGAAIIANIYTPDINYVQAQATYWRAAFERFDNVRILSYRRALFIDDSTPLNLAQSTLSENNAETASQSLAGALHDYGLRYQRLPFEGPLVFAALQTYYEDLGREIEDFFNL